MPTITPDQAQVTGGVDTHADTHTAAAIDSAGRLLGSAAFPATGTGYAALLIWLQAFGHLVLVGIEGTGVYGAGLARYLAGEGIAMVEIDRPDRKARRWQGKSDPVDAQAAARTALARHRTGVPKQRDGQPAIAARLALRALARRHRQLSAEISDLDELIEPLVTSINPRTHPRSPNTPAPAVEPTTPSPNAAHAGFGLCGPAPLIEARSRCFRYLWISEAAAGAGFRYRGDRSRWGRAGGASVDRPIPPGSSRSPVSWPRPGRGGKRLAVMVLVVRHNGVESAPTMRPELTSASCATHVAPTNVITQRC